MMFDQIHGISASHVLAVPFVVLRFVRVRSGQVQALIGGQVIGDAEWVQSSHVGKPKGPPIHQVCATAAGGCCV